MDSSASETIKKELLGWKGVTVHEHNFVSMIFHINGIEMGHLLTWRFDSRSAIPYKCE